MNNNLKLGQEVNYNFEAADKNILDKIDNPHYQTNYAIRLTCPEFTSICPVTSQPDFANIIVDYVADKYLVESKSFKLYLFSYRNHGAFHEDCTVKIAKDIIETIQPKFLRIYGYWYPRGGIPIDVFYNYGQLPNDVVISEPNIDIYKGR